MPKKDQRANIGLLANAVAAVAYASGLDYASPTYLADFRTAAIQALTDAGASADLVSFYTTTLEVKQKETYNV